MEKKKNILFIISDDHASNAISLYGSRLSGVMQTQNIDRIGKEGTWLTGCFCTNAVCTPSRASIPVSYTHLDVYKRQYKG